jgi:hypothetical protein
MRFDRIGGILPSECGKMPQIQKVYSHHPVTRHLRSILVLLQPDL